MGKLKDRTDTEVGDWYIIERAKVPEYIKKKITGAYWLCSCVCGTERVVSNSSLSSGRSNSCGCKQKNKMAEIGRNKRTHGETKTRLYRIWAAMKSRCLDVNQPAYSNYGGRGIKVSDMFLTYELFKQWAIANGYDDTLTLERINVNGNYTSDNCKFITFNEQAKNKRNTLYVTAWGETKRAQDWITDSRCALEHVNSLKTRLKRGYSAEFSISTPPLK